MLASKNLHRAADLIIGPQTWTQNAWARDESGDSVPARYDKAVCFCAAGAIRRSCWPGNPSAALLQFERFLKQNIVEWNDAPERTWEEVRDALRAAAVKAEGKRL